MPVDLGEKADHRLGERVVLVAGHHVAGAGDVDVARVRHEVEEGARPVLAHDVALAAADQQGGHPDGARRAPRAVRVCGRASAGRLPLMKRGSQCQR